MIWDRYSFTLVNISCLPSSTLFNALVELEGDLGPVLPYLNAVLPRPHYSADEPVLDFVHEGHIVSLRPHEARVTGVQDEDDARRVVEGLRELVNRTWLERDRIEPANEPRRPPSALEVLRTLPRTNCGECGVPTCLAFASRVAAQGVSLDLCPRLPRE